MSDVINDFNQPSKTQFSFGLSACAPPSRESGSVHNDKFVMYQKRKFIMPTKRRNVAQNQLQQSMANSNYGVTIPVDCEDGNQSRSIDSKVKKVDKK